MLNNALNSGEYGMYSITDLWTILGMEMLAKYKGSSNLRNNLFRKEADYFMDTQNELDDNNMRVLFADPLNSSKYAPIAVVENKVEPTFKDSMWDSDTIDFYFYRLSLRSAASSQAFAESVARLTASKMVDAGGNSMLRINVTDTGHKHKWLSPKYTWSDDHSTCTAYSSCKYDDTHLKQETTDAKAVTVKTKNGTETTYTAEFETEGFETQKVTITQGGSDNSADSGSNNSSSGGTAVDKGASAAAAELPPR